MNAGLRVRNSSFKERAENSLSVRFSAKEGSHGYLK